MCIYCKRKKNFRLRRAVSKLCIYDHLSHPQKNYFLVHSKILDRIFFTTQKKAVFHLCLIVCPILIGPLSLVQSANLQSTAPLPNCPPLISPKAKKILAFFHQKGLFFSIGKRRVNCPPYFFKILVGRGGS
jgi:hypothetical protein